ncbi:hypothetical protein [Paenibacillus nasutitermitis]|uniref:5-bromo-4-chloroindolyl phosphate hydrolysis protein n=1 Tax=Paenibacillus nasutitermitis TaxID=1652958 RepID=A0A917E0X5_9BACL|nr:hypothetical protein [Paenibacillus nasutitermitis]GGD87211.1 hypothetical protein GCM10010911_52050 [Paenibacillus nasutitermitis]
MPVKSNMLIAAAIGYVAAVVTSPLLPELFSLLIPVIAAIIGSLIPSGKKRNPVPAITPEFLPATSRSSGGNLGAGNEASSASQPGGPPLPEHSSSQGGQRREISPEFAPVLEYLEVLEDMVISEGQKNTLDDEIVQKSLALFARLQRVIPLLQELRDSNVNHTVRRLILKDLNGILNPFLRLSGEAKTRNRRMLLNGIKDVDTKISDIVSTVEHKDLLELQAKADLIHKRYSSSEL